MILRNSEKIMRTARKPMLGLAFWVDKLFCRFGGNTAREPASTGRRNAIRMAYTVISRNSKVYYIHDLCRLACHESVH